MKRLLFIFLSFLFYINCLAQETPIQLHKNNDKDRVKDDRSLSIEPTATYDGNTIYIYSDIMVKDVQITVKDADGNTVYSSDNIIFIPTKYYSFTLYNVKNTDYQLIIEYDNLKISGYFNIMN